ncbi:carbon monoxide dehydrogenase subunit G [Streptomyces sp. CB02923]|uniref:SRPBCC domain-containing protein n=1 Tax=Streptomyces sp. CB02923 TaxID=1718985 RepID=UPI00093B8118|nr:SRPBCC domain-containing protein [Streptomyces sp. CB02923]OKI00270.1 carbon monoxide dehydrogenase subunit G [Streptomyces sp. CB02923]
MEHEVYVPFPVETVRQALTEPERVARCIPGCQLDADADPGTPGGRLRLRIGSSTITYRGTLTVTVRGADTVTVEASGMESRGDGSAELSLTVRLAAGPDDAATTVMRCAGTVTSTGRLAEATDQAAESAGRRVLDRFAANLAADLTDNPPDARDSGTPAAAPTAVAAFDSEVPQSSLDPLADADDQDGTAPAEAAHARRTMIGRSAEEVDHAPPRGRYAPVPAPQSATTSATLRWAAPAAALALASAVVVGRVLRRRR